MDTKETPPLYLLPCTVFFAKNLIGDIEITPLLVGGYCIAWYGGSEYLNRSTPRGVDRMLFRLCNLVWFRAMWSYDWGLNR